MARKLRIQYPGAIYHVLNRGDQREAIFLGDQDRREFLRALEEGCEKTGWQVHAFCLMPNHFHLVMETPEANLVDGMKWLLSVYTNRFNRRHKLCGHLFSGRYKALVVDGSGNGYLKTVCDYVHLNPVRAGILSPHQPLQAFEWSSYPLYLLSECPRPVWLRVDRLMGEWGVRWDRPAAGRQFSALMEARRQAELEQDFKPVRLGWCVGSEQFRLDMLHYVEQQKGCWHHGVELRQSAQAKAERIISEALKREGITEQLLSAWRKGHPFKVKLARTLRKETTVTMSWIADRLHMGARGYLALLLWRSEQATRLARQSGQSELPM